MKQYLPVCLSRRIQCFCQIKQRAGAFKNEASLLEIINNTDISEDMKADAIASMNRMTDRAEKELDAELLLEAKGFKDSVVSINDDSVDVIVGAAGITDEQKAQIEDIVTRKTERKCVGYCDNNHGISIHFYMKRYTFQEADTLV